MYDGMVIVAAHDGSMLTDSEQILRMFAGGTHHMVPLGEGLGDGMCGDKKYGCVAVVEILSATLSGGRFMKALT